jgi:hypothetical protein
VSLVGRCESVASNANQPLTISFLELGDVVHENSQPLESREKFVH